MTTKVRYEALLVGLQTASTLTTLSRGVLVGETKNNWFHFFPSLFALERGKEVL